MYLLVSKFQKQSKNSNHDLVQLKLGSFIFIIIIDQPVYHQNQAALASHRHLKLPVVIKRSQKDIQRYKHRSESNYSNTLYLTIEPSRNILSQLSHLLIVEPTTSKLLFTTSPRVNNYMLQQSILLCNKIKPEIRKKINYTSANHEKKIARIQSHMKNSAIVRRWILDSSSFRI